VRRRLALVGILLACVLAGAWAAPRAAGPATYPTTAADVEVRFALASPSRRGIDVYVPLADWGLHAQVFSAPLKITLEPRRINRLGVVQLVTGDARDEVARLRREIDDALTSAARRGALLTLAGALAGGLLALLIWHLLGVRGWWLAVAPAAGVGLAAVLIGGAAAWGALTLDLTRLERPEYFASGDELRRIVEQADALRRSSEKYSDRVDSAIRSIAGLLDDRAIGGGILPEAPSTDGRRLALASDIHNNLLTLPALRRYSHDRLTVLAGDFTVNGGQMETPFVAATAHVGDPVVAVSGNHDSPGVMRTLAREGVRVLTHDDGVVEIGGLRFAGFEDPLAYATGAFPPGLRAGISFGDIPDGHRRFLEAVQERWRWWQALPERPDVLVVHQAALGRALANLIWDADPEGPPLAVLVGHTHVQRLDRYGPITLVDAGSVGAGGLFGLGTQSVGFALLDFDAAGALEATDLVTQNPATSSARAQRVITDAPDCDGELVFCHEAPELPEQP
jgi:predicted phosphodiesterase